MKCVVLIANRMSAMPIAECGGITVKSGDKLTVRADIADKMLAHYKGRLVWAETIERDSLANSHYELSREILPVKQPLVSAAAVVEPEPVLQQVASDKSMGHKAGKKANVKKK